MSLVDEVLRAFTGKSPEIAPVPKAEAFLANPEVQFPRRSQLLEVAGANLTDAYMRMQDDAADHAAAGARFSLNGNYLNGGAVQVDQSVLEEQVDADTVHAMTTGNYLAPFSTDLADTSHLDRMINDDEKDDLPPVEKSLDTTTTPTMKEEPTVPSADDALARALAAAHTNTVSAAHYAPENIG